MQNILKKITILLTFITLAAFLPAGCGKDNTQATDSNKTEKTVKHEALTITSFNNLIMQDFINAFNEKYPEIKLDVQSYSGTNGSGYAYHSLVNGDIPDIYISSQDFSEEAQEKYLLDLSNYSFVNNYSNTLLDSLDVNGAIYLLPSGYQLTGIYYNKTILEENGWEVPESFNELVALSKKIEKAGLKTMGHGMSLDGFPFNYFFNIGNTKYFGTPEGTEWKEKFPNGEAKAEGNSSLKETAEYFNKWVENGFITTEHTENTDFYEGKCVFFLCLGLGDYEYITEDGKKYEFGTIPWLSEDGSNNMLTRNVSRYMGINKSLGLEGNEQKLEDALELLNYISTVEGQQALMPGGSQYMPSLNEEELPEGSPYNEISGLVNEGRTVPLVYVGWEDLIIPVAKDIKVLIEGKCDVDTLLKEMDKTASSMLKGSLDDIYAVCEETLSIEQTAKLVAVAEGQAADADCAMVSLNEYHGNDMSNKQAPGWYIYKGNITPDIFNLFRPRSETISVLEMPGKEIKEMQKAGFDLDGNNNPYKYLLFTKGNMELEDEKVYKLAVSTGELEEKMLKNAREADVPLADAIKDYLGRLKTIDNSNINWED